MPAKRGLSGGTLYDPTPGKSIMVCLDPSVGRKHNPEARLRYAPAFICNSPIKASA